MRSGPPVPLLDGWPGRRPSGRPLEARSNSGPREMITTLLRKEWRTESGLQPGSYAHLTRTLHEYLLRRPILSAGAALLLRPPQRTAVGTPASSSVRGASAAFGLVRLATAFLDNPGQARVRP
jgi:hypothetical protein